MVQKGDVVIRTQSPLKGFKAVVIDGPTPNNCYKVVGVDKELPFSFNWHPGNFVVIQTKEPNWEI